MVLDLPTVIQVMPYAADVAQAEMAHPENQLAATQLLAQQILEEQNKQAQPVEQQAALASVREDRRERRSPGDAIPQRRHRRPAPPDDAETSSGDDTPFAGHIIDRKI